MGDADFFSMDTALTLYERNSVVCPALFVELLGFARDSGIREIFLETIVKHFRFFHTPPGTSIFRVDKSQDIRQAARISLKI